ncbi:MAG TPA: CehA/McbA family metallohydrolase, partial [Thermoanaerobaculia bacterium]
MLLALITAVALSAPADVEPVWLKGNLHTHTAESDGDSAPRAVAQWYADHGYDFLVISDHDKVTRVDNAPLLLIPGEEITDRLPKKPLHVNAIGITTAIAPQHGTTVVEVLQRNLDAVAKAGGVSLINHPNFGWAFGAEELLQLERVMLLEVASGHPFVNSEGPSSVESMWDAMLTAGKRVYGVAVDDMHHLARPLDEESVPPGRAWVRVRADKRDGDAIVAALKRGDFYASTGPELEDYTATKQSVTVRIRARFGARYRTRFVGSGGRLLQES